MINNKIKILLMIASIFLSGCFHYVKKTTRENMVRIALVCGANEVTVSNVNDKKPYDNYRISLNNTFPIHVSPKHGVVMVNKKKYRGSVEVKKINGKIWVINIVDIEDYLKAVVPCEIGKISKNLIEVAKAQAIAARTYASAHINQYQSLGVDLYATIRDQVYKGLSCETELTNLAIDETRGMILMYKRKPIEAKYHSTCGGRTADFNDAWQGKAPPYLKSVKCPYCRNSPHYSWEKILPKKKFFLKLRNGLSKIGTKISNDELINNIKLITNKKSKRTIKFIITTKKDKYVIPGHHLRTVLGDKNDPGGLLKSNCVTIKTKGSNVIIKGKGFGHGVGMCQFGAIEMARKGKNYKKILKHYYPRTKIKKVGK